MGILCIIQKFLVTFGGSDSVSEEYFDTVLAETIVTQHAIHGE